MRWLAGARKLEALPTILQDHTVVHDFLDHHPAIDALTLPGLTVVYIKDTLGLIRRIDMDIHGQRRQAAAKGLRQAAEPRRFACARRRPWMRRGTRRIHF